MDIDVNGVGRVSMSNTSMELLCEGDLSELIYWRTELMLEGKRIKASKINRVIEKMRMKKEKYYK